ncbi:discoidin domain-containing protein [Sinomicrobium sp. M5D2P17]
MKKYIYMVIAIGLFSLPFSCADDNVLDMEGRPDSVVNNDPPGAPIRGISEEWNDHDSDLKRQYFDSYVAIYYSGEVDREITWPFDFISKSWEYILNTYGTFGDNDSRLFVAVHKDLYADNYYATFLDDVLDFESLIDFSLEGEEMNTINTDKIILIMEELVENSVYGVKGAPVSEVWQDQFVYIFLYDLYRILEMEGDAQRIYDKAMAASVSYPSEDTYWFRDWFYPLYEDYEGVRIFSNFFRLLSEKYPINGDSYARNLNLGELIHFFSGATGKDLQSMAEAAFGWTDETEIELLRARADFPDLNYPFDPASETIDLTDEATLTVSHENGGGSDGSEGSSKLVDGDTNTKFLVGGFHGDIDFWMQQEFVIPMVINKYSFTSGNDAPDRDPKNWRLVASNDMENWVILDTRTNHTFGERNQTREFSFENETAYQYYRIHIEENYGSDAMQLSEWRLLVVQAIIPSGPEDFTEDSSLKVSKDNNDGPNGEEGSFKVIDGNVNTKFLVGGFSPDINFWMQQEFTEAKAVTEYTMTSANDAQERDPKNWELAGSDDEENWTAIDVRENQSFGERYQTKTFTISNETTYRFYRLYIKENNGSDGLQLAEWRLLGE